MSDRLCVRLHGAEVATLERFADEQYRFDFNIEWLNDSKRPVLGQIYEDHRPRMMEHSGLPCWFGHLLPQGPYRRWIARAAQVEVDDDFEILVALGSDLPGAVTVELMERSSGRRSELLNRAPRAGFGINLQVASLSGNQMKLALREGAGGLTVPLHGEEGSLIGKLADPAYPGLPRIERATMAWAEASGVSVPPFSLCTSSQIGGLPQDVRIPEEEVFVIQRFDRHPGARLHMEDFAQALDVPWGDGIYQARYERIAALLRWIAPDELPTFVHQLVFNIVAGNTDAHLKNWTLLYPDGRTPRLSPAYDLISTRLYARARRLDDQLALSLDGNRDFNLVTLDSFALTARVANRDHREVARWVNDAVERTMSAWADHRGHLGFSTAEQEIIETNLRRLALNRA